MLSLRQVINNLSFNITWQLSFFFSLPTTTRRRIKWFPVIYKLNTAYFSYMDIILSRKQFVNRCSCPFWFNYLVDFSLFSSLYKQLSKWKTSSLRKEVYLIWNCLFFVIVDELSRESLLIIFAVQNLRLHCMTKETADELRLILTEDVEAHFSGAAFSKPLTSVHYTVPAKMFRTASLPSEK